MGVGVTREQIQNISLLVLITLSFFLSYYLWSAGGMMNETEEQELQTSDITIATTNHEIEDVFRPKQVVLHGYSANGILLGDAYPLKEFLADKSDTMNLYQVEYMRSVDYDEYLETLEKDEWLELIFSEERPIGLYSSKIMELSKDMSSNYFDRVIVNTREKDYLYLYHTKSKRSYRATILEGESLDIEPFLNFDNVHYQSAESFALDNNIIYLKKEPEKVPYKSYLIDRLLTSTYISNFFPDTSLVDVRSTETFTRYIDLSKEVTINNKNDTLTYYKQVHGGEEMDPVDRYRKSFDQMNHFENWLSTFSLSKYDSRSGILSFRREIDGIPVYSPSHNESVSEVGLVNNEVTHLKLPLRYISTPISINESSKELEAGIEIMDEIKSEVHSEEFKKIQDLAIGYTWQENEDEEEVAHFNPEWYILYDGNWSPLQSFLRSQREAAYGL